MATYTYYNRLSIVHPKNVNALDVRLGKILAETATTGKFIIGDIEYTHAIAPNAQTSLAAGFEGTLTIYEPLGLRFLDYIRIAALELGILNHFDASFLLEVEIVSESLGSEEARQYRYVMPIMIPSIDAKSNERGTEYQVKFAGSGMHSQTDMVQPLKETITVENAKTVKDYFTGFSRMLELQEFTYAHAGQKFGSGAAPGGDHPGASDPYHDEYHFLIDPSLENFEITSEGASSNHVNQGFWQGLLNRGYDISAKGGTTLISQIQIVLAGTKNAADLYLGQYGDKKGGHHSSSSSEQNKKTLQAQLGKIYQFFKVETHTVYKKFDPIRGRYAVKHIFMVYLNLDPKIYQYPDEIDELNDPKNKALVMNKLTAYIQEGMLRKAYYYQYTGLNTEIIKFDLTMNQMYYLPSFPVIWPNRGRFGEGAAKSYNFDRQVQPFDRAEETKSMIVAQSNVARQQAEVNSLVEKYKKDKSAATGQELKKKQELLEQRQRELSATQSESKNLNATANRAEYLESLRNLYVEDTDYFEAYKAMQNVPAAIRPRMEPDEPPSLVAKKENQGQATMDKIMDVAMSSRDIVELNLEIRGDPYWFGSQPIGATGSKGISKLNLPSNLESYYNSQLGVLDPTWNSKNPDSWGDYNGANFSRGGTLIYFNTQLPTSEVTEDDLMVFSEADQVLGIYIVIKVTQEFKKGMWTQKLEAKRDPTIPSNILPKGMGFEDFAKSAADDPNRALDKFITKKKEEKDNRSKEATDQNIGTPSNRNPFTNNNEPNGA